MECRLGASDITVDTHISSELLQSGLLGLSSNQSLHNLLVSHPSVDISAAPEGVVYLMARKKYKHAESWALALDTRNKTLLGVAEFGIGRQPCASAMYFSSVDPVLRKIFVTNCIADRKSTRLNSSHPV